MKLIDKFKEKLPQREIPKAIRIQRIVALCVIGAIFLAFAIAYIRYREFLVNLLCDKDNLQAFLGQFGGFDKVVFVAIRSFQTVIKIIPAEPLELAAGAFYGIIPGMLYCLLGSFIGSFVIIIITKKIGRKVINLFVPIEIIDDFALFKNKKRLYTTIFFIYIIPSSPKDLLVYAAALADINIWKFLLITTVARIPNIIISTWCGAEFIDGNYTKAIIIFVASAVLAISLSVVYKKFLSKKKVTSNQEGHWYE